jgi:hypothetical protein
LPLLKARKYKGQIRNDFKTLFGILRARTSSELDSIFTTAFTHLGYELHRYLRTLLGHLSSRANSGCRAVHRMWCHWAHPLTRRSIDIVDFYPPRNWWVTSWLLFTGCAYSVTIPTWTQSRLLGAILDPDNHFLRFTLAQFANLKSLFNDSSS